MVRSIEIVYGKNKTAGGHKKGHVVDGDGEVVCGSNLKVSLGGTYKITKQTQAPAVWCKTCKRKTTMPWEE